MISQAERTKFEAQGYRFVGKHSAIKICLWCKRSMKEKGSCYKHQFYDIRSWQCIQMTPVMEYCHHHCLFCWRSQNYRTPDFAQLTDDPIEILDNAIKAQKLVLQGFKGNGDASRQKFDEAMEPKHVAISLAGEPTFYPRLSELIAEIHRRGLTSFLVTSGTYPEALEKLNPLPTQLYTTVAAPNEEVYKKTCRPSGNFWPQIQRSLEIMAKLPCRRVIRLTLVKGLNFLDPTGYATSIRKANPNFVEVKSFVAVGDSRNKGLGLENMIPVDELEEFAKEIAAASGYQFRETNKLSRVSLLTRDEESYKNRLLVNA